jgi:cytochrome c biogenesis protein
LTAVNFAVLQIILLGIGAAIGMTVRQLPGFAFRSASAYDEQMALIHARYDGLIGPDGVALLERLQVFRVFSSWWFSAGLVVLLISIVACTLNRMPRLWRQVRDVRVVQPEPFFDPMLPDRVAIGGLDADAVRTVLRRHRFRVREAQADGIAYIYGDRHQYTKLATLFTHLGLILFLVAAAVTSRFGFEAPLVVAAGETSTVQPIGTPGLLVVKNLGFEAPIGPDGGFADFTTDLAVFQDGRQIARKTIRVNDPLSVAGFTFHQNGFGPAPEIDIRDAAGALLFSGGVSMTDAVAGLPFATMGVPGRDVGLEMYLDRAADGTTALLVQPYRVTGTNPDGSPAVASLYPLAIAPGEVGGSPDIDFTVALRSVGAYTLLIAKQDPGQGIVWLAFGTLLTGLLITFYLPRRRVWARLTAAGDLRIVGRADRYVDFEREFGRLLDDLVARRRTGALPAITAASAAASAGSSAASASATASSAASSTASG